MFYNKFKAIIFDMDGLLVNSEVVWHFAEMEMIESRGHVYTEEARAQIVGLRIDEFVRRLHAYYQLTEPVEGMIAGLNQRMVELIPEKVVLQPGTKELLDWVVTNNIPRAIASNSAHSIIDATVMAMGWADVFQVRCSADDEPHGKPAPDVYLTAARRLNVEPSSCVALEDSPNGAKAVIAARMTCFAVPDKSHTNPAAFAEITPHVFDSLHDVLALFKSEMERS